MAYNVGMIVVDILRACFEIAVLWVLFYQLYRMMKSARAGAILAGLLVLVLLCVVVLEVTEARVLQTIAGWIVSPAVIMLVVIFQPEIRNALAKFGLKRLISPLFKQQERASGFVDTVADSVQFLASKRIGALICFCRNDKLREVVQSATQVDALYSRELIGTIFFPKTLLHDGAVVVDDERIVCAGAILPVSKRELKDRAMGLRHRAGIGMAESSDAVVVIVSEETGSVSLAVGNKIQRDLTENLLKERLSELLNIHAEEKIIEEDVH